MNAITKTLLTTVQTAGKEILNLQAHEYQISKKSNDDIVTRGDHLVNDILQSELGSAFPEFGWLSEESADDLRRLKSEYIWIVDPIDGTKEFAQQIPEYAISIALVKNGHPVLSSVYNPAANQLFYAELGQGAFLNNQSIHCRKMNGKSLDLLASRTEEQKGKWDVFKKEHRVKIIGSIAYKLALIACGEADATFSLGPKNEWDIAGGVFLILEAGGCATTKKNNPIIFNQENVLVDGIVASSYISNHLVFDVINQAQPK